VLRSSEAHSHSLQLLDCHSAYIYVLASVRSVELVGCCSCTVVVGAIGGVLSAHYCERLSLHATAAAARIGNCIDTSLFLCVNTPPLMWGENHRVSLAPYGTVYRGLREHMAAAQVCAQLERNCWARPLSAARRPRESDEPMAGLEGCPGCSLHPPAKYLPFHVPVDVPLEAADGQGVPPVCELPVAYAEALAACLRRLDDFHKEVSALNGSGMREVQHALHLRFKEWLVRTGNMRQLHDLMCAHGAG